MDEVDSVLVARFADPSTAYEALNRLRVRAAEGRVTLRDATVVQRGPDGSLRIPEHPDPATTRAGTNCGSCRPEIRALVRAARPRKAAGKAAQKAA